MDMIVLDILIWVTLGEEFKNHIYFVLKKVWLVKTLHFKVKISKIQAFWAYFQYAGKRSRWNFFKFRQNVAKGLSYSQFCHLLPPLGLRGSKPAFSVKKLLKTIFQITKSTIFSSNFHFFSSEILFNTSRNLFRPFKYQTPQEKTF